MDELLETISRIALEMPSSRVRQAATALRALPTAEKSESDVLKAWGRAMAGQPLVQLFARQCRASEWTLGEIASALSAAAQTAERIENRTSLDILWTGPTTHAVSVRRTEQALCELVDSAKESLFVVSFVAYKVDKVYKAIDAAIERGVHVSFLTEAAKEHGGTLDVDPAEMLKGRFPRASFYRWEVESGKTAAVHAKCAVADDDMALVTSANLTGAAMDNNMELGLLVKGGRAPVRLSNHLKALVAEKIIQKVWGGI